jgi:acyl-CoA thioesterase superfamily protein
VTAQSPAWFRAERDLLLPRPGAASTWADGRTVRGMASSAVMARAAEQAIAAAGIDDLRPARWTADLSRPVPMEPMRTRAEILRRGRRVCLVDVELLVGDTVVARARGLYVRAGATSGPGRVWQPARTLVLPPEELRPTVAGTRLHHSDEGGWTTEAAPHQNASRKQIWLVPVPIVETEIPSPFQVAAAVADLASVVTHWGDAGLAHINADLTLSLARLPRGAGLGVAALERVEADGVAIGTALVHDGEGVIGTSTVTAVLNQGLVVNPGRPTAPPG